MSRVIPYTKEHYETLCSWFLFRNLKKPPEWALSDSGFVVEGVAAGFLYLTNSGISKLDTFVSNPLANKLEARESIDQIMQRCVSEAKEFGSKLIVCETNFNSLKRIMTDYGFKESGSHLSFTKGI